MTESIYDIKINSINDVLLNLTEFKNKKLMIVNVASECGFTKQYEQLQELFEVYNKDLIILGCPCNDFGGQEPGNNEDIQSFCQLNFGVTFPLTEKIGITKNRHELYEWLMKSENNKMKDIDVNWNFYKFCIDQNGKLDHCFNSFIDPLDQKILDWIKS
jgi:glutathione peroxidase